MAELPATLVVFDVLERDGAPLLDLSLAERQPFLDALPLGPPLSRARREAIELAGEPLVAWLDAASDASRGRGNEGLMVKDPRSPYRPGRRGLDRLEVKRALPTPDVDATSVDGGHG